MKKLSLLALGVVLTFIVSAPTFGQAAREIKSKETVKFAAGSDSTVIQGTVEQGLGKEFVVRARRGQTLTVELLTEVMAFFYIVPAVQRKSDEGYGYPENSIDLKIRNTGKYTIGINIMMRPSVSLRGPEADKKVTEVDKELQQKFELRIKLK